MRGGVAAAVVVALLAGAADAGAQRPRVGLGAGAGIFLGSQLIDHTFSTTLDDEAVRFRQEVNTEELAVASVHAEWYATRHLALRVHGAWGQGSLETRTLVEEDPQADAAAFETGFGAVRVAALDAGVSIWPWSPRSVGFAPFVTVGIGTFRYTFEGDDADDPFFRGQGERSGRALLVGIGADMQVWRSVMLRMEAMNHMVDSPIGPADFALSDGPTDSAARERFGDGVSNVRLVLGAHIYLPFGGSLVPE